MSVFRHMSRHICSFRSLLADYFLSIYPLTDMSLLADICMSEEFQYTRLQTPLTYPRAYMRKKQHVKPKKKIIFKKTNLTSSSNFVEKRYKSTKKKSNSRHTSIIRIGVAFLKHKRSRSGEFGRVFGLKMRCYDL
jgi:hypothetical protein